MNFRFGLLFAAFLAFARAHAQPALTLQTATDREYYLTGARNQYIVQSRITARAAAPETAPAPHNIAFVVDRSGSMAGEPLVAVRAALVAAIQALRPEDFFSVVSFGSEVETLVEAQQRGAVTDLAATLSPLGAGGGAALYDALNQGAALLRRHTGPGVVSHLVLLTDGPATKGPREFADFAKLATLFASEGITLTAIGLGPDAEEDVLSELARQGHGRLTLVDQPAKIPAAFVAETSAVPAPVVARDVVLTVDFNWNPDDTELYGRFPGEVVRDAAVFRFPRLLAGEVVSPLISTKAQFPAFGSPVSGQLARVRLQWTDPADGSAHDVKSTIEVRFDTDPRSGRETARADVLRAAVEALITDGLTNAIEQLDKADPRRAWRALRRARDEARDMNYYLEDPAIAARLKEFEAWAAGFEANGVPVTARKLLRTGVGGKFEAPPAKSKPKR